MWPLVLFFLVEGHASTLRAQFKDFAAIYHKAYTPNVYEKKFLTWKDNVNMIAHHNSKNLSFVMAMNQFGDLTQAEFAQFFTKLRPRAHDVAPGLPHIQATPPEARDWRSHGVVTEIKNAGSSH